MNSSQQDDNPYRSPATDASTQLADPLRKNRRLARGLLWVFALGLITFAISAAALARVISMEIHADPASVSDLTLARFQAMKTAATALFLASGSVALLAGVAWLWTQFEPRSPKASANPAQAPD
jgi:hypothetical protein